MRRRLLLRLAARLRDNRKGVATVEFALWASLILAAMLPCIDFGLYLLNQSRLGAAVGQASILAYNMRDADSVNVNQLSQYVPAASGLASGSVTTSITCNGTQSCATPKTSRTCACPSGSRPVTYTPAASCGATCASGATAGYYLTVQGGYVHRSIAANPLLDGKTVTNETTVRLQ